MDGETVYFPPFHRFQMQGDLFDVVGVCRPCRRGCRLEEVQIGRFRNLVILR